MADRPPQDPPLQGGGGDDAARLDDVTVTAAGSNNLNENSSASNVAPAAAAAASASVANATNRINNDTDDDAATRRLAKRLTVMDQLASVYGFAASVAENAVDAVGWPYDINACYNYILDQGLGQDQGGPVYPIYTCPHVLTRVQITTSQLPLHPAVTVCQHNNASPGAASATAAGTGRLKGETNEDGSCPGTENWLCATCGALRCSRYVNGHGLQHWHETQQGGGDKDGHCVAISLSDLSVWCHICNAYILNDKHLGPLLKTLEARKFPTTETSMNDFGSGNMTSSAATNSTTASVNAAAAAAAANTKPPPTIADEPEPKRHRAGSTSVATPPATNDGNASQKQQQQGEDADSSGELGASARADQDDGEDDDDNDNHSNNEEHGEEERETRSVDSDPDALFQLIAEAAASQGIPLQWVLSHMHGEPIQDTGPVEYPFESLPKTLPEVAEFIKSDKCQRILVLAGAGMSVASGIPDFRSADGLYATLNVNHLTCANEGQREVIREDPSAALDQHLFLENPFPCLESQREFILGTHARRWKATLAHRFVELLHHKTGKLVRLYTQNIDGLEDQCANLPPEKVIAVHGSMDRAECARCETMQDFTQFCEKVKRQIKDLSLQDTEAPTESRPILCEVCGHATVKPAIVLFRSSLPKLFFEKVPEDVKDVDLLIIVGTSLKVAPANSLVWRVPRSAMRFLVNRETVGEHLGMVFGDEAERDVFAEGDIDPVLLDLIEELGWTEDLRSLLNGGLPDSSEELLRARLPDPTRNAGG